MTNRAYVLLFGPIVMCAVVVMLGSSHMLHSTMLSWAFLAVAVVWSPLFISVPAILVEGQPKGPAKIGPAAWRHMKSAEIVCNLTGMGVAAGCVIAAL